MPSHRIARSALTLSCLLSLCLLWLCLPMPAIAAAGDLTVTPTRIVFGERDRAAQVLLVNRGETRATFRVEFVQMRMDQNGQLVEIDAPNANELFADPLIRYSPRQVELEPNQSQTVRLLLRKPEGLAPGEYRSHLLFYALPEQSTGVDVERAQSAGGGKGFSVNIQAIYRVSIPVIVRHGDLPTRHTMRDLALLPPEKAGDKPRLRLRVDREGRRSIYGDIDVYFTPRTGGSRTLLRHFKDFVLYTSTDSRILDTELDVPPGTALRDGTLHAVYSEIVDEQPTLLAEQQIPVP